MSPFETFLKTLASALEFTMLGPDEHGVCLIVTHKRSVLFEEDRKIVPGTILMSTPLHALSPGHEKLLLTTILQGNSHIEETLSLKPGDETLYLHRRISSNIDSDTLKALIDTFVANAETWSTKLENTTKEHPLDTPDAKGSLKPNRFKV